MHQPPPMTKYMSSPRSRRLSVVFFSSFKPEVSFSFASTLIADASAQSSSTFRSFLPTMDTLLYLAEPINAVGIFFIAFTAIAFALRLYTKTLNKGALGLDDLFLLFAILCFDIENAIQIYCLKLARDINSPTEPKLIAYTEVRLLLWPI